MKKKMLFITTQFPYPLDNGGKIGAYNGICVASKEFDITVLSFAERLDECDKGISFYKEKIKNITFIYPIKHTIHIRKKLIKLAYSIIKSYLTKIPYIVTKFFNIKMIKAIDTVFKTNTYDVVFIDYLNMGFYGDYIKKNYSNKYNNIILKDHNIEFELVKQEYNNSKGLKRLVLKNEWKNTYKYEIRKIKEYKLVFTVCDENTEQLIKYNKNVYTMYPTYTMLPHRKQITNENNIIYIGNLSWKSNYDGITWFVENVMPNITNSIPTAKLIIAGGGLDKENFNNYNNVKYLGYVENLNDIYKEGKVFIVPLFEGSGIRIKILEAFNNEISVVSTTIGCDTIGAINNKEILIADDAQTFANSVIKLLKDENYNKTQRNAAKELLRKKFSLEKRQEEFMTILKKVCGDDYEENSLYNNNKL